MTYRTALVSVSLLVATIAPAWGQAQRRDGVSVELQGPLPVDCAVQLVNITGHFVIATLDVDGHGRIFLPGVAEGQYIARLVDGAGSVLGEEMVRLNSDTLMIRFDAARTPPATPPGGGRISLRELKNPPSKEAMKSFLKAQKYSEKGEFQKAVEALEKTVQLSPDFAPAHTNLGAQYLRLGQPEKAARESLRALEISGPEVRDYANLAIGMWLLGRNSEALRYAGSALELDKECLSAHFVTGSLLAMNPQTRKEGIRHLEAIADKLPLAAKNLAAARQLEADAQLLVAGQ